MAKLPKNNKRRVIGFWYILEVQVFVDGALHTSGRNTAHS
jgi:hypothetical protein